MIPKAYITAWKKNAPWSDNSQVEQDLIISVALLDIFSHEELKNLLAFRGGTALHKLYLKPAPRYSEDIDLVQTQKGPIKSIIKNIQKRLDYLGDSTVKQKRDGVQIVFRFETEFAPVIRMRLKIEINTREHFAFLGAKKIPFTINSPWRSGDCQINTFCLEELLATKFRALYQRRKGRDLFDLYYAFSRIDSINDSSILVAYKEYMQASPGNPPSKKKYLINMEEKMKNAEFLGDVGAILRPDVHYDAKQAYELVKNRLISHI